MVEIEEPKGFSIRVSQAHQDRALRIIDTIFKALDTLEYSVEMGDEEKKFVIDGEPLSFRLEEKGRWVDRKLTQAEQRELRRKPWCGISTVKPQHTGDMSIRLDGRFLSGVRKTWRDTSTKRLESRMLEAISGVAAAVIHFRHQRQEHEEWERKLKEEAQKRQEHENAWRKENERVEGLFSQADSWTKADRLRRFLDAAKTANNGNDEKFSRWLEWGFNQVDRLDPLTKSPSSILDEVIDDRSRYW